MNGEPIPSASPFASLVEVGTLSDAALRRAESVAVRERIRLSTALTRLGLLSERELARFFCKAYGLSPAPKADLDQVGQLPEQSSEAFFRRFQVVPIAGEPLTRLAMADPLDQEAVEAYTLFSGASVQRVVATATDIASALDRIAGGQVARSEPGTVEGESSDAERLRDMASGAPVIRWVNALLARAVDCGSSDIHLEPAADRLIVRLRIDGRLREIDPPAPSMRDAVISRIKIMARLDIAERRLPQDGRMAIAVRGSEIDFRVATAPTTHGESAVVRVLNRDHVALDFAALGFDEHARAALDPLLAMPHGIFLVTGPTGSGKTTSLYAALSALNVPERKITTVEDPVEYQLDGVVQLQVQPAIGLTFARALRSFLRQNPNVIMVGEIRDLETAQIAVQAALTGHLILSTLHTNDAASGITRLLDMGVENYLLISTVNAIMAQRLVRLLCRKCRAPVDATLGEGSVLVQGAFRPVGCEACGGSGYRGRTTILEILPVTDPIRKLVLARAAASDIHQAAVLAGMRTMQAHGLQKVAAGVTTLDEVLSVTRFV